MPDKELTLEIIKSLIDNEEAFKSNNLPATIEALISPFVKRRKTLSTISEDMRGVIDSLIKSKGYCLNCRVDKTSRAGDTLCTKCKKSSKELCKKKLQDKFLKL